LSIAFAVAYLLTGAGVTAYLAWRRPSQFASHGEFMLVTATIIVMLWPIPAAVGLFTLLTFPARKLWQASLAKTQSTNKEKS